MTDFKEALTWIEEQIAVFKSRGIAFVKVYEDIRRALLIADRLMQDPTYAMVYHGAMAIMDPKLMGEQGSEMQEAVDSFKAMRDQLIREVEQGSKCNHAGYSFKKHGRRCPHCGEFLTDFGD